MTKNAKRQSDSTPVRQPRARLMKYIGKGQHPKQGHTVVRTYEECPENYYPDDWEEGEKLYTARSVPLTDDEIKEAVRGAGLSFTAPDFKVARAIEAAHGITKGQE